MRLIAPHVRRAVLIGRAIDLKSLEAETFAHALDSLANAMFLVDATGRIVHANAAGCALTEASSILRSGGGKLIANDAGTNRSLRDIFLAAEGGDTALGTKGIAMPLRAEDGNYYVAHVLPLTSGLRRRAGVTAAAVAAVFIQKTELAVSAAPEVIAKTYSLTPTELRVMLALAEVGGAPKVADLLGIAETTVKFHLRNLFDKTGVRRQADLIKLLAGFTSPVAT
jgi:DNA-binding CsgD family transcriptional regulator